VKRREDVFSPVGSKMIHLKISRYTIYYNMRYKVDNCFIHSRVAHKNSTRVFKYKIYLSSFRIFSAASFKSLLTASSRASFAILITSRHPSRLDRSLGRTAPEEEKVPLHKI
jgi:hypothetical protein